MTRERERDVERSMCPCCGYAGAMRVEARVWMRAWVEPRDPVPRVETQVLDDAPAWDADAACECEACGYAGRVRDFTGEASSESASFDVVSDEASSEVF